MDKVAADNLRLAPIPIGDRIGVQQLKIFMLSIEKQHGVSLFADFSEQGLFFFSALPQKTEIAADDQGVAFFEAAEGGIGKTGILSMQVAGDIDHRGAPPFRKFWKTGSKTGRDMLY